MAASMACVRRALLTATACLALPSTAMAASDASATSAYLRAEYRLVRAEAARVDASIASINGEATSIASKCPSSFVGTPAGKQLDELHEEVSAAVFFAGVSPDRRAIVDLVRKIAGLRWRNGRITALVRALVSEEKTVAALVLPDVCTDIGAWKASGYQTVSQSTMRFIGQLERVGSSVKGKKGKREPLEAAISRLVEPYESSSDRRLVRRMERLGEATGKRLGHVYDAAMRRVAQSLG